ncbi:rhodanese-like domain-containing protein [Aliagarivorans marinus]|uniref:rhodanese-like domain-containing protein n=1 Tax=Aliagarivorans marinus TaxID=561965 RepID=UPI00041546B7|nr:rhodanese-like domain-containing protein [Aliagarivorans marinus]
MQQVIEFAANHPIMSLGWVGLFGAVVYSFIQPMLSKVKTIGHHEATMLINKQDAVVVDVRTKDEMKTGKIAGSVHIPQKQIQASDFKNIEKYKASPIIVVCETGMRSGAAGAALAKAGFEQVYSLRGGMADWRSSNLPVTKTK